MRLSTVFSARGLAAFALICAAVTPLGAQTPDTAKSRQHIVKKGDTLWDLAQFYCSDPFTWPTIYKANTNVVENPHWIYPAERLAIPCQRPDSTRPVQVAQVMLTEAPPPTHTRFYIPERKDTSSTIISSEMAKIPLVQRAEWLAAPWIADTARLGIIARVFKPFDPRDQNDKLPQNFHPRDKLFLATAKPVSVNDRLLAIRLTRDIRGFGWVIEPLGILRIDSITPTAALAFITSQFDMLKVGDLAIPLPTVPPLPSANAVEVTGGPTGEIIDFLIEHPLYGNTDYAFINLGTRQGLGVGDELLAYLPERQASEKDPQQLPSQPVAHLQVIRANDGNATVRVTRLSNTGLKAGLPVRVSRKVP